VKGWTKADWENSGQEWDAICANLAKLRQQKLAADSPQVQAVIARHHKWLKKFWTPNRQSYTALGLGYTEFEWKKAFAAHDSEHPNLAMFLAKAMDQFANDHLK